MRQQTIRRFLAAVAALTVCTFAIAQPADQPAPRLELSRRVFDFGEVWQGNPAKAEFKLKNAGTAPLVVAATSSCGCALVTQPRSPLPAGQSTSFSISYDTKLRGRTNKRVTLTTNDPKQRSVVIPVRGVVKALFDTKPTDVIKMTDLDPGAKTSASLRLVNTLDKPIALRIRDKQENDVFSLDLKAIKPGYEYELVATTVPPLPAGRTGMTITLETDFDEAPRVLVDISAYVPPRVAVAPTKLYVSPAMTEPTERTIQVRFRKDAAIRIENVKATPDTIKWQIIQRPSRQTSGKTAARELRVTLPPFQDLPARGAKLEIYTSDPSPEYHKLEVPIIKRVLPPRRQQAKPPADKGKNKQ